MSRFAVVGVAVAWIATCTPAIGQPLVDVIAAWDGAIETDPAHPIRSYELERDGVIYPCAPLTPTECAATVPPGLATWRLRGVVDLGAGPWSEAVSGQAGGGGGGPPGAPAVVSLWFSDPLVSPMAADYTTSLTPASVTFAAAGETQIVAFDAGSAANRVLYVAVTWRDRGNDISGITYNGVSLSARTAKLTQSIGSLKVYRLAGPASGVNDIAVTMGAGSNSSTAVISAWVAESVDQTTPDDAAVTAQASTTAANVVSDVTASSQSGDRVLFVYSAQHNSQNLSATPTNYTERQDANNGTGFMITLGDAAGAASITGTATWSNTSGTVNWIGVAININAASAGATGDGAATLAGATSTAAGAVDVAGTGSAALVGASGAGAGAVDVAGAGAAGLEGVAGAAAGAVDVAGTGTAGLEGVVGTADGVVGAAPAIGAGAATLAGATSTAAGAVDVAGTASAALAGAVGASTGAVDVAGAGAAGLEGVAGTADGVVGAAPAIGTGAATLAGVTSTAAGAVDVAGTGSAALAGAVGASAGAVGVAGAGAAGLENVAGTAEGVVAIDGQGAAELAGVTGAGTGGDGSTVPAIELIARWAPAITLAAAVPETVALVAIVEPTIALYAESTPSAA